MTKADENPNKPDKHLGTPRSIGHPNSVISNLAKRTTTPSGSKLECRSFAAIEGTSVRPYEKGFLRSGRRVVIALIICYTMKAAWGVARAVVAAKCKQEFRADCIKKFSMMSVAQHEKNLLTTTINGSSMSYVDTGM